MADYNTFIQQQQEMQQQQELLMHTLQSLLTSGNAGTHNVMTTLEEMLSIIENRTNSITTQLQGTQPLTSLADAIHLVHERTQEQAQQHVQVITAIQAIVKRLIPQPTTATDGTTPSHLTLGHI